MSGVRLEISFDDGGLGNMLCRAAALGENLGPALEASGQMLEATFDKRFETESGPGGIPWVPSKAALGLEPRASSRNNRVGGRKRGSSRELRPGKTLTDRGTLRASLNHTVVGGSEVHVGTAREPTGEVAVKAAALQFGVAGINLPARPYVGFDDQDVEDLEQLWGDVLRDALEQRGTK